MSGAGDICAADGDSLERLRQALQAQRQILQELEEALREFERTLPEKALSQGPDGRVSQLLSLDEVCRALGMGKS
jgi:polysaccharide pyruvyl transferase WcaK-like protein